MNQFKCSICGSNHPLITLFEFPLPSIISDISSGKINQLLTYFEKNVLVVNRKDIYILCDLSLKIQDYEDQLDLLVWVKVTLDEYRTKFKKVKDEKLYLDGELIHLIPFYEIEEKSKVTILWDYVKNESRKRILQLHFDSKFSNDFKHGISIESLTQTLEKLYHLD